MSCSMSQENDTLPACCAWCQCPGATCPPGGPGSPRRAQPLPTHSKQAASTGAGQLSSQQKEWLQCRGELGTCPVLTAGPSSLLAPFLPAGGIPAA